MVVIICRHCGDAMDSSPNIDDLAQWYAINHSDLPVGGDIEVICGNCSRSYDAGDSVVLRSEPDGTVYIVVAVDALPDQPDMVTVRDPDGFEAMHATSQLQPSRQIDPDSPPAIKKDGYF